MGYSMFNLLDRLSNELANGVPSPKFNCSILFTWFSMSYQKESSKVLCYSKIGTPPRFEMDWKAPEDSVSHGLCKQW